eukprot:comp21576_c0_seq1/m.30150 comp21576_c0_seq1/g.30150  ORF comp21576_c0_seq1/g.30150 comp21576_c0_seq1/m.30150 type:complete len:172 (-) comp21576_c0_seq1:441-956(-)
MDAMAYGAAMAQQPGMQQPGAQQDDESPTIKEQDRLLPIANIGRLMKRAIPESGKMAKDAKECVQECASEFIGFITSEASDRCHQEKRKTINGEDILWAMQSLGFDPYIEPLKLYLQQYRESVKGEKTDGKDDEGGMGMAMMPGQVMDQAAYYSQFQAHHPMQMMGQMGYQ